MHVNIFDVTTFLLLIELRTISSFKMNKNALQDLTL